MKVNILKICNFNFLVDVSGTYLVHGLSMACK